MEIAKHPANELAKDHRVDHGGLVFGLDRKTSTVRVTVPTIDPLREVELIGAALVVIRPTGPDREPERHVL